MRRFAGHIFNSLTVLSLLLCVAATVLWVRSYITTDSIEWGTGWQANWSNWQLVSSRGRLIAQNDFGWSTSGPARFGYSMDPWHDSYTPVPVFEEAAWKHPGLFYESQALVSTADTQANARAAGVPHWLTVMLFAVLPLIQCRRLLRVRHETPLGLRAVRSQIYNTLNLVSFLLCIVAAGLWALSYSRSLSIHKRFLVIYPPDQSISEVEVSIDLDSSGLQWSREHAQVYAYNHEDNVTNEDFIKVLQPRNRWTLSFDRPYAYPTPRSLTNLYLGRVHGFIWRGFSASDFQATPETAQFEEWEAHRWTEVTLPCWFLVVLFALLPVVAAGRSLRRRPRWGKGACQCCGYDLRATPDRCPNAGQFR